MTVSTEVTSPELRAQILAIARRHGARTVRLFGSRARGEATADSDVDLLLDMPPERSLLDLIAIEEEIEELLGLHVDLATTRSLSPYIREAVEREAIEL
jgi:uncharacterized protein